MKNIYFTGDSIFLGGRKEAEHKENRFRSCLTLIKKSGEYRILYIVSEDMKRMKKINGVFQKTVSAGEFIIYAENIYRDYNRIADMICLHGDMCHYHISPGGNAVHVRNGKITVMKQKNYFFSETVPFWKTFGIKAGDMFFYGKDIGNDAEVILFLSHLFHANNVFRKSGTIHMSCCEMLEMTEYDKGNHVAMIGVHRR